MTHLREPRHRAVSVVVPVYNSAATLPRLLERLAAVLCALCPLHEVILVNDGSRDESWTQISSLAQTHAWLRGINLSRNYGQHNALLAGIRAARYEVIVTLDDDLQNPPEEIPRLLVAIERGYDVVYGTPSRAQHGVARRLASRATKLALQGTMGADVAGRVSAYRVFRTSLREAFVRVRGPFVNIDVLLTWSTTRFAAIPVRHDPRDEGTTNYTFGALVTHALNMLTGFTTRPLQVASLVGFSFTLFGMTILGLVLGRYALHGGTVPGFTFLASSIAIFSGAQLFALGVIGEYLARMYFRTMERPAYVIRDRVGLSATGEANAEPVD